MTTSISTIVLNPGSASAPAVRLDDALSFWGGFDPQTGNIIDQHHPQAGVCVKGCVLVIPRSRGSAGTPAGVAESLRTGYGPLAIILRTRDVNISVGAMVADRLYATRTAVLVIDDDATFDALATGDTLTITENGDVTVT